MPFLSSEPFRAACLDDIDAMNQRDPGMVDVSVEDLN